tara:strand:- start:69 stop:1127 length:1059 start_codon:yes stop_codon:yes gene_type:complete
MKKSIFFTILFCNLCIASPKESLMRELSDWIANENSTKPEYVEIIDLDPRLKIQPCPGELNFSYPFVNRESVRVRCSKPKWQLFVKVSFLKPQNTLVLKKNFKKGYILREEDFKIVKIVKPPLNSYRNSELIIGKQINRDLSMDHILLSKDFEKTISVLIAKRYIRAGELLINSMIDRLSKTKIEIGSSNTEDTPAIIKGKVPLGLRIINDIEEGEILRKNDLSKKQYIVVAAKNLLPRQIMTPDLIKLGNTEINNINQNYFFELTELEGLELTRSIREGEPIRSSDLRPALLVKKGEIVLFKTGDPKKFQISIRLEALQDGRMGDQIKLKNRDSGRIIGGTVLGKALAKGV